MFTHFMVGADDIDASKKFYDAILGVIGVEPGVIDRFGRVFYHVSGIAFGVTVPIDGEKALPANGGTIGFGAASPEQVDAWHEAGLKSGGVSCESPPGVRAPFASYAAYLRDPMGNKLCISCPIEV